MFQISASDLGQFSAQNRPISTNRNIVASKPYFSAIEDYVSSPAVNNQRLAANNDGMTMTK